MKLIRTTLFCAFPYLVASFWLVFSGTAFAQYIWLDASGRKVFSDQPPPTSIPAKRILQQPSNTSTSMRTTGMDDKSNMDADGAKKPAKPKTAVSPALPNTGKDKDLEAVVKKAEDEAAAKKKAEQDMYDKTKADNCVRAKQAKGTLDSGIRLSYTNAKGERGFMDDAARIVESKRIEGVIASDCK
jgi:Domain of unknown function (DUF4124)